MATLSVIIVSYKQIQILRDCLDSIKKFNDIGEDLEVIVSDNSPSNDLVDDIKNEYEWVKIIKNDNIGFGAGNNRGYEVSSGKYLLFLNPDTVLIEPIFKFAVDKFEKNKNLALFGVQLVDKNLNNNSSFAMLDSATHRYGLFKEMLRVKKGRFKDKNMIIIGADLFIRKETFEEIGKFDENIFMYREEEDLVRRIKLSATAKQIAFFNDKKIIHLEGGTEFKSYDQLRSRIQRENVSESYYAKKWDLNLKKIIKNRIRFLKTLMILQRLTFKSNKANEKKQMIEVYKLFLKELKQS